MRKPVMIGLLTACAVLLAGCGGGSGSSAATSPSSAATTAPTTTTPSSGTNVQAIVVDSGPAGMPGGAINEPFVSVTVCAPADPSNCQTIDHVLVDTGSYGLRIISSVLSPSLASALPQQTDSNNNAIVECTGFADGYSWGPIKTTNMRIGGETANALGVQVIGDPAYNSIVPENCSGSGVAENTVATFGANGILGVGAFAQDCGGACVGSPASDVYYSCNSSCQPIGLSLAQQVQNPITLFATDNNGVIISLPAIAAGGTTNVGGSMIFGVGTQANNGLGSAQVYTLNPVSGYFTTTFNGVTYPDSFLDSGSNGLFFNDSSIPQCADGTGFYCPSSILTLSAVNTGANGSHGTVNFSVGSESNVGSNITAYSLLAGTNGDSGSFDWGLSFFFGRNVYTVIENKTTSGGTGPYVAY